MNSITEEIENLKRQKNAVILAHYYVPAPVQEIADYIGDSYSEQNGPADRCGCDRICRGGLHGESAKS